MSDLRIPLLLLEGEENMAYRPENNENDYNASQYWKRKQSVKDNKVSGEAPEAKADRDCDAEENFSYGKSGYGGPFGNKGKDIWNDE